MRCAGLALLVCACATSHRDVSESAFQGKLNEEIPVALPDHLHAEVPVEALPWLLGIAPPTGHLGLPLVAAPLARLPRGIPTHFPANAEPAFAFADPVPGAAPSGLTIPIDIDFKPAPSPAKLNAEATATTKTDDEGKATPKLFSLGFGLSVGLIAAGVVLFLILEPAALPGLIAAARRIFGKAQPAPQAPPENEVPK